VDSGKQGRYVIRSCFGGSNAAFIASGAEARLAVTSARLAVCGCRRSLSHALRPLCCSAARSARAGSLQCAADGRVVGLRARAGSVAPLNLSLHAQRRPVQRAQRTEPVDGPRATGARRRGRTAVCTSGTARAAMRWRRWRATRAPSTRCPGTPPTRTCSRRRPTTRPSASGSRPPRSAGHPTPDQAPRSSRASARMLAAPPASAAPRSPGRPGRRTPIVPPDPRAAQLPPANA